MPVPLALGPLTVLGAKGVSEAIAVVGVAIGAGAFVATLPTNVVGISPVDLRASRPGGVVGDRVVLTATCEVSFGDTWFTGSGLAALFETDRRGTRELARQPFDHDVNPKPVMIQAPVVGKDVAASDFFVAVEVTGEDDVLGPRDETVTRHRRSDPVSLTWSRPYSITASRVTDGDLTHGEDDRYQAKASNAAQFPVEIVASWESDSSIRNDDLRGRTRIPPGADDRFLSLQNFVEEHLAERHEERNPISYAVFLHVYRARMRIEYAASDDFAAVVETWRDPLTPERYLAGDTRCVVPGRRVSLILPGAPIAPGTPPGDTVPRRFAFALTDEAGRPVAFTAAISDDYGADVRVTSSDGGVAEVAGSFTGDEGTLVATPRDGVYAPVSARFAFDDAEADIEGSRFAVRAGPTLVGSVSNPRFGPIRGALLTLEGDGEPQSSATLGDGSFRFTTTARDWRRGAVTVTVRLPWVASAQWERTVLEQEVDRAAVESGRPLRFVARLATADPDQGVPVAGRVLLRDESVDERRPLAGATVRLRDAAGATAAEATTDGEGAYRMTVRPGVYGLRVAPPAGMPVRPLPEATLHVGDRREDVDVAVRLPRPQTLDLGDRLRVVTPPETAVRVALVAGAEIVAERSPDPAGVVELDTEELADRRVTAVAYKVEGAAGGLQMLRPPDRSLRSATDT